MEFDGEHLGDDVQVGNKSRLQDNRNIGSVEELDWVTAVLSTVSG